MHGSEVLFEAVTVVDGTGSPRYVADVLVEHGVIRRIDRNPPLASPEGASGPDLVLAPGFIDMHAHSDLALLDDSAQSAKLTQGVTTQVIGQDGIGYAPVDDDALALVRRQISGWNGDLSDDAFTWRDMGGFLAALEAAPLGTNAAVLVPQGNLRLLTIGSANRPATASELDRMCGLLADGLAAGAAGMSSGLTYTPGMYASTDELETLCTVVAQHGGYWAPHTRGYGRGALDAFRECIGIGLRTGCPVHLTHATMNFEANRGRAAELLALIDDALAGGADITLDSYPYLPGSTTLAALLPSWAHEGGPDATLALLDDPAARERLRAALEVTGSDGAHGETVDWAAIQVSGVQDAALAGAVGLTVAEWAGIRRVDATTAALELMRDDGLGTSILMHVGDEDNVRAIMRHPHHSGGSDGILVGGRPHPRAWGAFARYLGHYTRDLGVLTLEECVRHLAGAPARRLGLTDRGVVREGAVADLVVFDAATVADRATFEEPRLAAAGVVHVLVGGRFAVRDGVRTGVAAGRLLRS
ncbi:MAG TPA: D-aminoacylase [Pseudolysinimonas sp.]|nr:D-aminoacylase [Pseudolysinimonas sp.]